MNPLRRVYVWGNRARQITCPICGRTLTTFSKQQRYCNSPECHLVRYERKKAKIYLKRQQAKLRKEHE